MKLEKMKLKGRKSYMILSKSAWRLRKMIMLTLFDHVCIRFPCLSLSLLNFFSHVASTLSFEGSKILLISLYRLQDKDKEIQHILPIPVLTLNLLHQTHFNFHLPHYCVFVKITNLPLICNCSHLHVCIVINIDSRLIFFFFGGGGLILLM